MKTMKNTRTGVVFAFNADVVANNPDVIEVTDNTEKVESDTSANADQGSNSDNTNIQAVADAITSLLEEKDPAKITGGGKVRVEALTDKVGFDVTSAMRSEAMELLA